MRTVIAASLIAIAVGFLNAIFIAALDFKEAKSWSFGYDFKLKNFLSNWGIATGLLAFSMALIGAVIVLVGWVSDCPGFSPCARP